MANNSSILQYCHGMSIEGVLVFYRTTELRWYQYANSWGRGRGGLTVRWNRKSSLLRPPPPPPPLLPGSRLQKGGGGGGVTAGQYGTCVYSRIYFHLVSIECKTSLTHFILFQYGSRHGGPLYEHDLPMDEAKKVSKACLISIRAGNQLHF